MNAERAKKAGRRSRAEAEELVREFDKSGLSRKAFSSGHGLSVNTLDLYRRRMRPEPGKAGMGVANRLVAVEICGAAPARESGLALVLSAGRRIEVEPGFDADTLERLVKLLERGNLCSA